MNKTIIFKDNCLCLNMREMVDALDDSARLELAHLLSLDDVIIKNVADQILIGWTEDGSSGASNCITDKPSTPLSVAQRRVAKESSETAKREIEKLEHGIAFEKECAKKYMDKYFILYHAWRSNDNPFPREALL